ncbi:MAG: hypothetical protein COA85_11120 [Robiginitomaculum sp.]|nr:MAG: hypothetical protein COA85_11120 [Robiginitomaculum sp.]
MTLEEIYFIGQTVAVVAILASLVFVGLQVRQSNRAAVQANRLARADMSERTMRFFGDTMGELMRHPELAAAFRKVMFDDTKLTPVELTQILTFLNTTLNIHRTAFLSFSDGLIDERVMQAYESNTTWYLTAPIFAREWRRMLNMQMFDDEFANYVKNRFSELYPDHPPPAVSRTPPTPKATDGHHDA